jgi:hypothetical protein
VSSESYGQRPTIEDVKRLQASLSYPDYHIVWFDEDGFVMAHTDEERATIDLETCSLHLACTDSEEMESVVPGPGYYIYLPAFGKFARLPVEQILPRIC